MRGMAKLRIVPLALALALLLAACGGSDNKSSDSGATSTPAGSAAATIVLKDLKFNPDSATIKSGETVTWKWDENVLHNVTGDGFKSANKSDGTFSHKFTKSGTFDFQCTLHSGMKGHIEVS
jgi:plastocyanin